MNRDQLTEALAHVGGPAGKSWNGDHYLVNEVVIAAARILLDFPTDEMVEAAANALHQHGPADNGNEQTPRWQDCHRRDAHEGAGRNVLEAVRRSMIGETE